MEPFSQPQGRLEYGLRGGSCLRCTRAGLTSWSSRSGGLPQGAIRALQVHPSSTII